MSIVESLDTMLIFLHRVDQSLSAHTVELCASPALHMYGAIVVRRHIAKELAHTKQESLMVSTVLGGCRMASYQQLLKLE